MSSSSTRTVDRASISGPITNTRLAVSNKPSNPTKVTKRFPVEYGGTVDKIRIIAYPYNDYTRILEDVIKSFRWAEESEKLASVEATITFYNVDDFARTVLKPGTWLQPQYLNEERNAWIPLGPDLYVWERARTDNNNAEASVTAFDIVSFLNRQDAQNWQFKTDNVKKRGWLAHEIASTILKELEINSSLVKTKKYIPYLYLQNHTPYEAIIKAYTRDRQLSNVRYRIQANRRRVEIQPYTTTDRRWLLTAANAIQDAEWNESLDGLYTEVVVLSQSSTSSSSSTSTASTTEGSRNQNTATSEANGTQTPQYSQNVVINAGARAISEKVLDYGRIRNVVYLDKEIPSAVLKVFARDALKYVDKLKSEVSLTCKGVVPLRAGDAVDISDPGTKLSGTFFVTSVTHSIENGDHNMNIRLSRTAIVPVLYPTRDELVPANSTVALGSQKIEGPLGVAWYPLTGGKTFDLGAKPNNGEHALGSTWMDRSAIDLKIESGSPIYAPMNGTISNKKYGKTGTNNHSGKGYSLMITAETSKRGPTIYIANLGGLNAGIENGRRVQLGEIIGYAGINPVHVALSKDGPKVTKRDVGIDPSPYVKPTLRTTPSVGGSSGTAQSNESVGASTTNGSSVDKINMWIQKLSPTSPMKGLGSYFVQYCTANNVNPDFLVALGQQETQLGVKGTGRVPQYNPFGFASNNAFTDYIQPIKRAAEVLKQYYFSENRFTIAQVIAKYSPPGASNDPGNTNAQHPYNIAKVMERMGYSGGVNIDIRLNKS